MMNKLAEDMESRAGKGGGRLLELWTAQTQAVLDTLESEGVTYVRNEYVDKKYQGSAWIFRTAYKEMGKLMSARVPRPEEAQSPIWLYKNRQWVYGGEGSFLMRLAVPSDEVAFFDLRDWSRVLNLELLGTEKEREAFDNELRRQGVSVSSDLFEKPWYPVLKKKVTDSWKKSLLQEEEDLDPVYTQAAVWRLKKEWIRECLPYRSVQTSG